MIVTPRLRLRRPTPADLHDLHQVMRQPVAMRYWATPEHETPAETAAYLQRMIDAPAGHADDFVIEHQGRVIGKAGAWRLPEIGYLLDPAFWGRGLMAEALSALIPHLFAAHALPALTAEVDPRNAASLGLLARFGFAETHRAERTLKWRDEWCDSIYLALPRAKSGAQSSTQSGARA